MSPTWWQRLFHYKPPEVIDEEVEREPTIQDALNALQRAEAILEGIQRRIWRNKRRR
jgi:hypothetical protein